DLQVRNVGQAGPQLVTEAEQAPMRESVAPVAPTAQDPFWTGFRLAAMDIDLRLGKNHVRAGGALGVTDSRVELDVAAPELAAFWPELPGGAQLKGMITGALAAHSADLTAQYTPAGSQAGKIGSAPMTAHVVLEGGWGRAAG